MADSTGKKASHVLIRFRGNVSSAPLRMSEGLSESHACMCMPCVSTHVSQCQGELMEEERVMSVGEVGPRSSHRRTNWSLEVMEACTAAQDCNLSSSSSSGGSRSYPAACVHKPASSEGGGDITRPCLRDFTRVLNPANLRTCEKRLLLKTLLFIYFLNCSLYQKPYSWTFLMRINTEAARVSY